MIDEMIEIMIETLLSSKKEDYVNQGMQPTSLIKNSFLSIEYSHIQYILEFFHKTTSWKEAKNFKQYLKSMFFNVPTTIDSYYTAKVNELMSYRHDRRKI